MTGQAFGLPLIGHTVRPAKMIAEHELIEQIEVLVACAVRETQKNK
ncbi:MAG: hypothetical protein GY930_02125 [bacterium]|nr:hypothetical protein [bacterium]